MAVWLLNIINQVYDAIYIVTIIAVVEIKIYLYADCKVVNMLS